MNKKGFAAIIYILLVVVVVGISGYFALTNKSASSETIEITETTTPSLLPSNTVSQRPSPANSPPTQTSTPGSFDCGKSTFIVIAGGPHGPYDKAANERAMVYFKEHNLKIVSEGGSRFIVEPPEKSARNYWMEKVSEDGIGSTQYDNVGCDRIRE